MLLSTDDDGEEGYYDFVTVDNDYNCNKKFSVETIKTYSEYLSAVGGSNSYSDSIEGSVGGGAFGVNFEVSAKYEKGGNSEEEKTRKLFEEKQGEILLATASCYTRDVEIDAVYVRPRFTRSFIGALKKLQK